MVFQNIVVFFETCYSFYPMEITIVGTKKCKNTKRAERYFSDRGIAYHFRDFSKKPLSTGELNNILSGKDPEDFIDIESPVYKKKGMAYMEYDAFEEIEENNDLLITPVVRFRKKSCIGVNEKVWKEWVDELKT